MKKVKAPGKKSNVVSTKHLPAAGSLPVVSAKIGGVANLTRGPTAGPRKGQ